MAQVGASSGVVNHNNALVDTSTGAVVRALWVAVDTFALIILVVADRTGGQTGSIQAKIEALVTILSGGTSTAITLRVARLAFVGTRHLKSAEWTLVSTSTIDVADAFALEAIGCTRSHATRTGLGALWVAVKACRRDVVLVWGTSLDAHTSRLEGHARHTIPGLRS